MSKKLALSKIKLELNGFNTRLNLTEEDGQRHVFLLEKQGLIEGLPEQCFDPDGSINVEKVEQYAPHMAHFTDWAKYA